MTPSIAAFLGYYSREIVNKFMKDNVSSFCNIMFREVKDESEKAQEHLWCREMSEKKLKNYYEIFCFLNNSTEKNLSEKDSLEIFKK